MTAGGWGWRVLLALVGAVATGYLCDEMIGGGLLAWVVGGLIVGATAGPLFKALFARNAALAARSAPSRTGASAAKD